MRKVGTYWLPDSEEHMALWIRDSGGYQLGKQSPAMELCKQFRVAIDVGAHVGTWARNLTDRFETVHCFEPIPEHLECLKLNAPKAIIHPVALADRAKKVSFIPGEASTGDTRVHPHEQGEIEATTLDSFGFENVDFIKLDCEGYELFALMGGVQTIQKWKPVIVVEQKPGKAQAYGLKQTQAVDWLMSMGAKLRKVISGDYFLSWDE